MRNWERPMVVVDTFAANEFVSTCGEKIKYTYLNVMQVIS